MSGFTAITTDLPGVVIIEPTCFGDDRGFFMETWSRQAYAELGIHADFVQDNHSKSRGGVLRGLHYQLGQPQAKLVRVIAGAVFDVAVDIRQGSPTFGRWVGVELSVENQRQLFVPEGFAHGFLVLAKGAEFVYKCSDYYAPAEERGLRWDDPGISIDWPIGGQKPLLSAKDKAYPTLDEADAADLPHWKADP